MNLRTSGKRLRILPLMTAALLAGGAVRAAPPVVRTVSGGLLTIDIGDDTSFQVTDRRVPDTALFQPSFCAPGTTGDTGTLVSVGGAVYGPDFASHPCGNSVTQAFTAWTPVSISPVTGTGTESDPFTVRVVVAAGATGLRMTETWTHVASSDHLGLTIQWQNAGSTPLAVDTFVATDMYLGIQYVAPFLRYGRPGGIAAEKLGAPTPACAPHAYYALLPNGTRYTGVTAPEMWGQVAAGSLTDVMHYGCSYEGIATQLANRTLSPGQSVTFETSGLSFVEGGPFDKASVPAASPIALGITAAAIGVIGIYLSRHSRT
jgi:hypothetical protein